MWFVFTLAFNCWFQSVNMWEDWFIEWLIFHVFIYCIALYLSISIVLLTAWAFQRRSRPQQLTLCWSLHVEMLQSTGSEGLAQGLYMAARAGFEPVTLRSKGIVSTNAPPCPTFMKTFCLVYIRDLWRPAWFISGTHNPQARSNLWTCYIQPSQQVEK